MTTIAVPWPATEDEVTAAGLAEVLDAQASQHAAWAVRNRADGHMAELAWQAAAALGALAGELTLDDEQAANATARRIWRALGSGVA